MPQRVRATQQFSDFNIPVSYKIGVKDRLKDARNVYTNQDILETRFGISRYNDTAFSAAPLSLTFFKNNAGTRYLLAKDGASLYTVAASGAHTEIKAGLTTTTKHRAVTTNGRHIVAIEADGLFQFDGTTFTQLGQVPPGAPTVGASGSGNTLTASDYQVAYTFYDSGSGFESNRGAASSTVTVGAGQQIEVSAMSTSAANGFIDKKRIYLKDITNNGDWLLWAEIALATATNTINDDPETTIVAPTKNAAFIGGGAKYIVLFGNRVVVAGNSTFLSDVFFCEPYTPGAFDDTSTAKTINVGGNGPITGLGSGYYSDGQQTPYLVMFKERHIELYTEISGAGEVINISNEIGCVAPDSITIINGDIWFMSHRGFHKIDNGKLLTRRDDKSFSVDKGDLEDIFTRSGYVYELNKPKFSDFFAIYYPQLDMWMNFVKEGSNNFIYKSYNYEFKIGGFRPYDYQVYFTSGAIGDDTNGNDVVYLAGEGGYIYQHSISETVGTDVDRDGTDVAIEAFALGYWLQGDDLDATYNFGSAIFRAIKQDTAITFKFWVDFNQSVTNETSYDFSDSAQGALWDVALWDVAVWPDGRTIQQVQGDILRTGLSLLIGVYKQAQGETLGLINGQIDFSKNGNINSF